MMCDTQSITNKTDHRKDLTRVMPFVLIQFKETKLSQQQSIYLFYNTLNQNTLRMLSRLNNSQMDEMI